MTPGPPTKQISNHVCVCLCFRSSFVLFYLSVRFPVLEIWLCPNPMAAVILLEQRLCLGTDQMVCHTSLTSALRFTLTNNFVGTGAHICRKSTSRTVAFHERTGSFASRTPRLKVISQPLTTRRRPRMLLLGSKSTSCVSMLRKDAWQ